MYAYCGNADTAKAVDNLTDAGKAVDKIQTATKVHGNSLSTTKETVGYALRKNVQWKIPNDNTGAVITAKKHIASSHGNSNGTQLPETCVIFEMDMAISFIEKCFSTETITEHIPGFITDQKCIRLTNNKDVCFLRGGYGAPAAVDTLETVLDRHPLLNEDKNWSWGNCNFGEMRKSFVRQGVLYVQENFG